MRVAYFVHDVTDPAVGKRVRMLQAAGAEIALLGFRRGDRRIGEVEGARVFDLGRTYDARLAQRAFRVLQRRLNLGEGYVAVRNADVLLARNLEMLAIAVVAQRSHAPKAALAYECLDIHRMLLGGSPTGRILRSVEHSLMQKARLLIVSSPAFISRYFAPLQGVGSTWNHPVLVVENKVLDLDSPNAVEGTELPPGPPWRIGWFGMIRCSRSLDILCTLVRRNPGYVEVVIRGRPARTELANFDRQISATPGVSFGGAYQPGQLKALYESVHFNWAIDYFEEGANSALLLPNRIYEGSPHGAVPIALLRTETGCWLKRKGLGVLLDSPADELGRFLEELTPAAYGGFRQALQSEPRSTFVCDRGDCERMLLALASARQQHAPPDASTFEPIRSVNRA